MFSTSREHLELTKYRVFQTPLIECAITEASIIEAPGCQVLYQYICYPQDNFRALEFCYNVDYKDPKTVASTGVELWAACCPLPWATNPLDKPKYLIFP